jgi:glycosyltransferase involved in cell wall biosynthesis
VNNSVIRNQPAITVVALCYNHSQYVIDCLESIRNQSFRDFELIITDDCSSDASPLIIENWASMCGLSYSFIKHTENQGICKTLNEALSIAKGRYLAMIATDDVWLPMKLECQFNEMECYPPSVGVLYSDAYQINENSEILNGMFIAEHRNISFYPQGDVFELIAAGNFIPAMSTLIRMDCFKKVGTYDEALIFEDWDMWLRIAFHFEFRFSDYISAKYRILQTSMMRTVLSGCSPAKQDTFFRIRAKCLESKRLSNDLAKQFRTQIWDAAYALYVTGYKGSSGRLFRVYKNTGNTRALFLGLIAFLGISHNLVRRIKKALRVNGDEN